MTCQDPSGFPCLLAGLLPGGVLGLMLFGLTVGFLAGLFHFKSLKVVVRRMMKGDWAIALQIFRFGTLGAVLWGLALMGGYVVVAGLVGIMLARVLIVTKKGAEL